MPQLFEPANRETLQEFLREKLQNTRIIVVSNREPYVHFVREGEVAWKQTVGGLTSALDPVMRSVGGLWVAHGSADADGEVTDERGRVQVPPDDPAYTLRRVWLEKQEEDGYYYGMANQAIWPLCHNSFTRPVFLETHWKSYRDVNEKFADAVVDSLGDEPAFVFIQDYHFTLLPRMIKQRRPNAICAHFWHIPWPSPEGFSICPWKREMLDGLLGNDLIGFQTQNHCRNFLATLDRELETRSDHEREAVVYNDHATLVRPFPISVDFDAIEAMARSKAVEERVESLQREFGLKDRIVVVGMERMDYTKGIPDRLRAVNLALERNPSLVGKLVLIQSATPSRGRIPEYQSLTREVDALTEEINWRHGSGRWKPIVPLNRDLPIETVTALYRLADVCIVSSLDDGMNLVAKEFAAARVDEQGVLLLSQFAGAACELAEAVPINPYALDDFAARLQQAIDMSADEQRQRMQALRRQVRENSIYKWTLSILEQFIALRNARTKNSSL